MFLPQRISYFIRFYKYLIASLYLNCIYNYILGQNNGQLIKNK